MGQIRVTYDLDGIQGLCTIESTVHGDSRGWFMETFNKKICTRQGCISVLCRTTRACR